MSLVGSLEDLPFSDILQILCLSRRSGTLHLNTLQERVVLHFRAGLISGLDLPGEESPLVQGIRREKLVPPEVLEQALRECRRVSDSLLRILAAKSYLDPARVREVIMGEVRQVLRRLLQREEGDFCFEVKDDEPYPEPPSRTGAQNRDGTPSRAGTLLRIPEGLDPREILLEEMAALGEGSAYHFFLPAHRPPSSRRSPYDARPSPDVPMDQAVGDGATRVVLVDERSVYRDLLASAWRREGFDVESFISPEAGYQRFVTLAEGGAPVSLVTDLVLPESGGNGYAGGLSLLVRARQQFPAARVILMSEGVDSTVEEAASSLGALGILQKPTVLPADAEGLRQAVDSLARNGIRLLRDAGEELSGHVTQGDRTTETVRVVDQLSLLRALLGELRRPGSELEIPLLVLRLASEYFERGILLSVRKREARGLGGFVGGDEPESMTRKCRDLILHMEPGSRLREVVESKSSVRGRLEHPEELRLLEHLGGGSPREVVLLPLLSQEQVVAVLYGDNGRTAAPVGDTRGLEIFLGEVGLALEKSLPPPEAALGEGN